MYADTLHLYADDTVIFSNSPSLFQAVEETSLYGLKLVLNAQKTKLMFFTRARSHPEKVSVLISGGTPIEKVSSYKYLTTCNLLKRHDHASLRFFTNAKSLTHHCTLYQMVGWTSLYMRRELHLYVFIYKAHLGKLLLYTQSTMWLLLKVPRAVPELGKTAFSQCAAEAWNSLQGVLQLDVPVPL
ncbi:unnamed protein product, partial [Coregonus sp. 'balchen']